jgi:hypothetical protein
MMIELTERETEMLLTSLKYSHRAIVEAPGTPYDVRRQNLGVLDSLTEKVRKACKREQP